MNQTAGENAREWLSSAQILREYVFPKLDGLDWFGHIKARCCPQPRRLGLSLCCGDGMVERRMVKAGICLSFEGIDIAPKAIEMCQKAAESDGLRTLSYRVADLENIGLEPDRYDLVIGWMALHHVKNLDGLFRQVRQSMRRDGVFIVNEYVGPSRFQAPAAQVELINEWLAQLPKELRRLPSGGAKNGFSPPTVEQVIAADPSEALNSHMILPLLERHFRILERVDLGGGLLHWVLHDMTQNFDPENEDHRAWLHRLYAAEREAMDRGAIGSDFSFVIASKGGMPEGTHGE